MTVTSCNAGRPHTVEWLGRKVSTAIFKYSVKGPVRVSRLNLDGDKQADPRVHGGPKKAVYAYPTRHYPFWQAELDGRDLPWGSFGENLTIDGLEEKDVHIGDVLKIRSVVFQVTQPRMPCYKLGLRFGDPGMVKRFFMAGRPGFYLSVLEEGELDAGDAVVFSERDSQQISVADVWSLFAGEANDPELARQALALPLLPRSWKEGIATRAAEISS